MAKTRYVWSSVSDSVLQEKDGHTGVTQVTYTNEPTSYGPLRSERRGSETRQYHFDALGSTRALTDENGEVTDTLAYDAWGNEENHYGYSNVRFRWVGRYGYQFQSHSVTGFYVRARCYQSRLSLWLSRDPLSIGSVRSYLYADQSPATYVDITGLKPVVVISNPAPQANCYRVCRGLALSWIIKPLMNQQDAEKIRYISIIQKLTDTRFTGSCHKENDCCVPDTFCLGSCTFYEFLGTIAFDPADWFGAEQFWLRQTVDTWQQEKSGACTVLGPINVEADIRMFVDNDLTIYREVMGGNRGWNREGEIDCGGCNIDDDRIKVSRYSLFAPFYWNKPIAKGSTNLSLEYDCCSTPMTTSATTSSSTTPSRSLRDCRSISSLE